MVVGRNANRSRDDITLVVYLTQVLPVDYFCDA